MKVCIVTEGSYPYVVGGVSSWIQQLITNLPSIEFSMISINPEVKYKGRHKYQLPDNLVHLHELFLDELLETEGQWDRNLRLTTQQQEAFKRLFTNKRPEWPFIFDYFREQTRKGMKPEDILKSRVFYDFVLEAYRENSTHIPFTDVYWTLRSMYVHMFSLLLQRYPPAHIYHPVATGYAGLVGAYAAHLHQGALLLTEHGIYTREREEEIIEADWVEGFLKNMWIDYFYVLSDSCYTQARQVVTLFPKNKEIEMDLGCPPDKIAIVPNGVKADSFAEIARIVSKRTANDGPINVGAVVRLVPIKDIQTMLRAFSLVNQQLSSVFFYIMGPTDEDEKYYQECLQYQEYLGLQNVIFTGRIDVKEYLGKMDLLVLTSISEGQPLVILEGLACGLPFVVTDVGDCGSLIRGDDDDFGPAGEVVPVMNYVKIARGITKLGADAAYRKKCGEAGRRRVQANYSFEAMIESYADIYKKMTEGQAKWQA